MTETADKGDRIAKVMARAGVASRRDAEKMILGGRVAVNGKVVNSPALDVAPSDKVTLDGKPIDEPQPARLWLYYKPVGLVTSAKDEKGRQTVFDTMPEGMPRVMSVGRLDLTSEGLLLLTNDGELKRRLELPSTGWLRKYRVRVNGRPNDATFDPLRRGVVIEGEEFQPMDITLDKQQGANAWLTVGLREGRNREIRRAMSEVGLIVNRLIRVSYGPFRLNTMKPGDVVEVKQRVLRDQLGAASGDAADVEAKPARKSRPGRKDAGDGKGPKKPFKQRAEGDTPRHRDDAGPRPARSTTGRSDRKDAKPRRPRDGEDGRADRQSFRPGPRGEGPDGRKDFKPRRPRDGEDGRGDRQAFKPGSKGKGSDERGDFRPRRPRDSEDGPSDRKPFKRGPREEGSDDRKDFRPRRPRDGEGTARERDAFKPRSGGDRAQDRSGPKSRAAGERSAERKSFKPRTGPGTGPRKEGGGPPRRDDKDGQRPRGDKPLRPRAGDAADRPRGPKAAGRPGGPGKGGAGSSGSRKGTRPAGPSPRRGPPKDRN